MIQEPHTILSTIYGSEKNASVLQSLIRMYARPMVGSAVALHAIGENHRLFERARLEDEIATRRSLEYEDQRQLPVQTALQPNLYSVLQGMPGRMRYDPLARIITQPNMMPTPMDPGMFLLQEEKFSHVKEAVEKAGACIARSFVKEAFGVPTGSLAATGSKMMKSVKPPTSLVQSVKPPTSIQPLVAPTSVPKTTAPVSQAAPASKPVTGAQPVVAAPTQPKAPQKPGMIEQAWDTAEKAVSQTAKNPWLNATMAVGGMAGAAALSKGKDKALEYMAHEITPAQSTARRQAIGGYVPAYHNAYGEALEQAPNMLTTAGGWR